MVLQRASPSGGQHFVPIRPLRLRRPMKPAAIYSIPSPDSSGLCWKWRAVDGTTSSKGHFIYCHDCLANAQAHGYSVHGLVAHGDCPLAFTTSEHAMETAVWGLRPK